jgi:hypothetical protein
MLRGQSSPVAPNRGELDLLRIAAAYEEATGFDRVVPPLAGGPV